jgi:hypothetical protein
MAAPEEPARTPPDPEQRKGQRPWNWILITALAAVLVIAGAILGAAELVSSHSSDSSGSSQPPNVTNNNTNQNTNKNSQSQSQQQGGSQGQGGGQGGGQAQSQAVIVPYGQPFNQGNHLQQRVRIEINNTVTIGVKVFYLSGWYVLAGPCHYSAAAGGCTGRWFGPQRPPGYGQKLRPMKYRQQSSVPSPMNSPSAAAPSQQPPSSPPAATPSPQPSVPSVSTSALEQAVGAEQGQALAAAPSSSFDYTGPGNVAVTVSCTQSATSFTTYDCNATDGVGDRGTTDVITVNADGTEWSDTGMSWTGPYVTSGTFVTPSASDEAIPSSSK